MIAERLGYLPAQEAQTQLDVEKKSEQPAEDDRAEIRPRTFRIRAAERLRDLVEVFLENRTSLPGGL